MKFLLAFCLLQFHLLGKPEDLYVPCDSIESVEKLEHGSRITIRVDFHIEEYDIDEDVNQVVDELRINSKQS